MEQRGDSNSSGDRIYIPMYQRNYRWAAGDWNCDSNENRNNNAAGLMKDIVDAYMDDKDFVLGILTVYHREGAGIEILDGQQRLITLCLIMRVLGDYQDWLYFERDKGFYKNSEDQPRHNYLVNKSDNNSVDVSRMCSNSEAVGRNYVSYCGKYDRNGDTEKKAKMDCAQIREYIKEHVKFHLVRTTCEPIDEFLNMNFKKTPFAICDYVKSYLVMDSVDSENNRKNNSKVSERTIIELWRSLQKKLYYVDNQLNLSADETTNYMYELIKENYTKELLKRNRLDILFEDKYYYPNERTNKLKIVHDSIDTSEKKMELLNKYNGIMGELLEELFIRDINGKKHPNYNAYNAYRLLCAKIPDVHFFKLFEDDPDLTVAQAIHAQFNLTAKSEQKNREVGSLDGLNQFMHTMVYSDMFTKDNTNRIAELSRKNLISHKSHEEKLEFVFYYNVFKQEFDKYIQIIESAKHTPSTDSSLYTLCDPLTAGSVQSITQGVKQDSAIDSGSHVLSDLFADSNIEHIIIPAIQRDYVMGSTGDYLLDYLYAILWDQYRYYAPNKDYSVFNVTISLEKFFENAKAAGRETIKERVGFLEAKPTGYKESDKSWYRQFPHWASSYGITGDNYLLGLDLETCQSGNGYTRKGSIKQCGKNSGNTKELLEAYYGYVDTVLINIRGQIFGKDKPSHRQMNMSTIVGYLDTEAKTFYVYDGQQRITTVVVLMAYNSMEKSGEEAEKLRAMLKKYYFNSRVGANNMLCRLLTGKRENLLADLRNMIDDQTSYSIYSLVKKLRENEQLSLIKPEFLLEGMLFQLALLENRADAEQMFMEVNSGLSLDGDEKYKAELVSCLNQLGNDELKKRFLLKVDNDWLNSAKTEAAEVKKLKFCITMARLDILQSNTTKGINAERLTGLSPDIFCLAEKAMDRFSGYKINYELNGDMLKNIEIWCIIMTGEEDGFFHWVDDTHAFDGRLRFTRDDFILFLKRALEKCEDQIFIAIHQVRTQGYIAIPETVEKNDNFGMLLNFWRDKYWNIFPYRKQYASISDYKQNPPLGEKSRSDVVIYGGNSGVTIAKYLRTQDLEYKVGIYHALQRDKPVTLTYRLPGSPSYSSTNKAMPLTCSDSIETIVNRVKDEPSNKMHLVSVNFGVAIESASEFLSKMENDAELIKLCHDIQCGVNLPSEVPENIRAERLYFDWYVFWSKKHDSISSTFATSVLELLAIAKAENDTVFETRIKNNVVDWCINAEREFYEIKSYNYEQSARIKLYLIAKSHLEEDRAYAKQKLETNDSCAVINKGRLHVIGLFPKEEFLASSVSRAVKLLYLKHSGFGNSDEYVLYVFLQKVVCGECGKLFYPSHVKGKWQCVRQLKPEGEVCNSRTVSEEDLKKVVVQEYNRLFPGEDIECSRFNEISDRLKEITVCNDSISVELESGDRTEILV